MTTDLAIHATVRELCAAFVSAERDVRAAFAQIVAAEERVNAAFAPGERHHSIHVSACGSALRDNFRDVEETIAIMTKAAWRRIVDRLELKRFMSIKRFDDMMRQLDEGKLPVITEENVMGFARSQLAQARDMLQEAVLEVFEWLRPRGWTGAGKLKTNGGVEVGQKAILPSVVSIDWGRWRVSYHYRQHLIALENVFNGLAGNGEICKANQSLLHTAIEASTTGEGETDMFAFRACRNGNLHLSFKRPDLLTRFNQIAGGKRLRPAETEEQRLRREVAKARAENERLRRSA